MKWFFKLLLPFCFVSWGHCLQLSDILTQARIYLRDTQTDSSRQRFSDAQLTSFANNGQREMNLAAWAVVNSSIVTLSPGTTEYSLPSDHITVLRVTMNNQPVVERTFSFLDDSNAGWISDSGTVTEYYIRTDSSIVSGVSRECIGLHPVSTFTATLSVQYLAQPPDLANTTDIPFSGNNRLYPYHQALAYYVAYRGWLSIPSVSEAQAYRMEYNYMVAMMESNTKNRAAFNPNFRGANMAAPPVEQPAQK